MKRLEKMTAAVSLLVAFLLSSANALLAQEWYEYIPELDDRDLFAPMEVPDPGSVDRSSLVNFNLTAQVLRVSDGDTIVLSGAGSARFTIRMSDFDTPETSHNPRIDKDCACNSLQFRPGQNGGQEATLALRALVNVGDEVVAQCYEMDFYGRAVCHVFADGKNVNLEMIRNGWGWLPSNPAWVRDADSFEAESEAKAAKLGAWGLKDQVSPREWRAECWGEGNCDGAVNWPHEP